jgi:putative phosphoesterase
MKIAVISDIHANIHALEAVWEDLWAQDPDQVYCLGDLVGYGAHPNEVVEFIRARDLPTVMGNHDEGVGFDLEDCGCAYTNSKLKQLGDRSLAWSRAHTAPENKRFLQTLPRQIRPSEPLLLVHGSPRRTNEYLHEDHPQATFERIAKQARCRILVFGHTHLPYQKRVSETLFVNAGSVGRPKDGDPRASYAILDANRVELRRVGYDVKAAGQAIRDSDMPDFYAEELSRGGDPQGASEGDVR